MFVFPSGKILIQNKKGTQDDCKAFEEIFKSIKLFTIPERNTKYRDLILMVSLHLNKMFWVTRTHTQKKRVRVIYYVCLCFIIIFHSDLQHVSIVMNKSCQTI